AGGHHAVEPDTVAAHDGGAALALLVEVVDPDALGVDGAELEDVGHLHAALHFKRATAAAAGIATASEGNLGDDVGAPVALVVHVADVPVGRVGASDEVLRFDDAGVGHDEHALEPNRPC